jgi:hypothetical protein
MHPVEEKLYEIVGTELATRNVNRGLWTKAFSAALGDEAKAKALYIEVRVAQLRAEFAAEFQTAEERRAQEDADIRSMLRALRHVPYSDTDDIPAARFDGSPNSLRRPIPLSRAASLSDMLEFQVIDLIKRGYIRGIRYGDDWYLDLAQNA